MNRIAIFVVVLLLAGQEAMGYRTCTNQRLDYAIGAGHSPKLVVAGRITDVKKPATADESAGLEGIRLQYRVVFHIDAVISGRAPEQGGDLDLNGEAFEWPEQLVPLKKGAFCILILSPEGENAGDRIRFVAVVPAHSREFSAARDVAEVRATLTREILAELHEEKAEARQRLLIQQVSPIITPHECYALARFLDSRNPWVRRAALAGMLYARSEDKYAQMVREDIEQFLKTVDPNSLVTDLTPGLAYDPVGLLFSNYFFLDTLTHEDGRAKAVYLPLFRMMASNVHVHEWYRWHYGVKNLCRFGDRTDAATIYAYCADRSSKDKQGIFRIAQERQDVIIGISRILKLDLPNWMESDFLTYETQQHKEITDALIKAGLIKPEEAHSHTAGSGQAE